MGALPSSQLPESHEEHSGPLSFTEGYDLANPTLQLFDPGLGDRRAKPFRKPIALKPNHENKKKWPKKKGLSEEDLGD